MAKVLLGFRDNADFCRKSCLDFAETLLPDGNLVLASQETRYTRFSFAETRCARFQTACVYLAASGRVCSNDSVSTPPCVRSVWWRYCTCRPCCRRRSASCFALSGGTARVMASRRESMAACCGLAGCLLSFVPLFSMVRLRLLGGGRLKNGSAYCSIRPFCHHNEGSAAT